MRPVLLAILFTLSASAASAAQETPVIPGGASPPRADTRHCDRSRVEMIDAVPADSAVLPAHADKYLQRVSKGIFFYFAPPEWRAPRFARARAVARRDGSLAQVTLADSSGQPYFDREVRHALEEASKARVFAPLPDGVAADSLPLWLYFGRRAEGGGKYLADRTVCPAWPSPRNPRPAYPPDLRSSNITGMVRAEFTVDTAGRVVPGTFVALASSAPEFTQAVVRILDALRFMPAEIQGRKVTQVTQLQFTFDLGERQVR